MKNDLIVILAYKRKTVADVHQATGIPLEKLTDIYYERTWNISTLDIVKICNYLNITTEELFGRRMQPERNQHRQSVIFKELVLRAYAEYKLTRKEEADD